MRLRSVAAVVVLVVAACGGGDGESGGLPAGDHVHSLGITARGGLLLGLHGGLYHSVDGEVWELVGLEGEDAMVIAAAGQPLFVAGHEVLYRSDDDGVTFTPLRPPDLPGLDIHAFAQAPGGGTVYAFVVGFGVFASTDAGETWEQRAAPDGVPGDLIGLAVVGSGTDTLVLVGAQSGIFRSEDGGRTLIRVAETPSWAVAVDPVDPDRLWSLGGSGLFGSGDAGQSWEPVSSLADLDGQPVTLTVGPDVIWVATEEPRALHRSRDRGDSWELVADT